MGYTTEFKGVLKFKGKPTTDELGFLNTFLSKDRRDIGFEDDEKAYLSGEDEYWYHIDLKLTEDFSGLEWNGCEKTYDLHHIVNFITTKMREKYPKFSLTGNLVAQGEEVMDRWTLKMVDGIAKKIPVEIKGKKITCPHCEEEFVLEDE